MKISFKQQGVAVWLLGAVVVGIAGCGGGSSSSRPAATPTPSPTTPGNATPTPVPTSTPIPVPMGSEIVYRGGVKLNFVSLDGSNRVQISTGAQRKTQDPAWLAGRREIVYIDAPDAVLLSDNSINSSIRRINRDGTDDREIISLDQVSGYVSDLAASPDGRRIAYTRRTTSGTVNEIFLANADGSGLMRLTSGLNPAWSPNSQRLVFADFMDGQYDLFTINVDGSNRTRVAQTPRNESDPDWSPDGRRFVYVSAVDPFDAGRIAVSETDGSNPTQLTTRNPAYVPKWTPDNLRIVYNTDNGDFFQLFNMNADGSNQVPLPGQPITPNVYDLR